MQHRWLPLAAKTLPALSRERFQPAAASVLFAVARVPFFSWYSCYAPLRQKTAVTRLETAERSRATVDSSGAPCEARVAQTSFALRLRSRNSCVTSHVTLSFFLFFFFLFSAVFRCVCDPPATPLALHQPPPKPWGGGSECHMSERLSQVMGEFPDSCILIFFYTLGTLMSVMCCRRVRCNEAPLFPLRCGTLCSQQQRGAPNACK